MTGQGGPWVTSALFCEAIEKDATGLGIIRGITNYAKLELEIAGEGEPTISINAGLRLALGFAPDQARGRAQIRIDIEGPDGLTRSGSETSTHFTGPDRGDLIDVWIETTFTQEGAALVQRAGGRGFGHPGPIPR
jgi:hypothetical protein